MSGPKETPPTGLTQKQLTFEVFKLLNKQDEARIEAAAAQAARDEAQAARDGDRPERHKAPAPQTEPNIF